MLRITVKDATAGFRAFRSGTIEQLQPESCDSSGYAFQVEVARRAQVAGPRIADVPIRFEERETGDSKNSTGIALEAVRLVSRWGWRKHERRKR